ncbi:MAG TPA: bifunctional 4-hydroxy-2-oxoglutarate aldolase/2-dehydro-3-deoxy-phosphogluconate aldolase [Puia sp.]|nr:bifunctional 4-hydroxy-2-oxoglutarate aldolase/2-dehydro-3-deoxy-phosphogluconate aldolase [Puia sp.]
MNREKIIQAIIHQGVLPLYFHPDEETSIKILQALYASGIRVVEYTNRGKQALRNFRTIKKETYRQFPDLILGLGTVIDPKTAAKGIQNGADFLVSPGYTRDLSKFADNENKLWIPGCITPTELFLAQDDGLQLVKLFPANTVGPGFVQSVKEVFPDLLYMPTGGVNSENLESWFRAGVSAVGMGGSLISHEIMEQKNFDLLKLNTGTVLKQIAAIRSTPA